MIPNSINRIVRLEPCDVTDGEFSASARRALGGEGIDIDVCDASGARVMAVEDYRTIPLPFSSDAGSLARLTEALRGGSEICNV